MSHTKYHKVGTHMKGPLYGDLRAAGGLLKDMPIELVARRSNQYWFNDFVTAAEATASAAEWVQANIGSPTSPVFTNSVTTIEGVTSGAGGASKGVLYLSSGTASTTGSQWQLKGTSEVGGAGWDFKDTDVNGCYAAWEARVAFNPAVYGGTLGSFMFGMVVAKTAIMTTAGAASAPLGCWFRVDATNKVYAEASRDGTTITSVSLRDVAGRTGYPVTTGNPLIASGRVTSSVTNNATYNRYGMRLRTDDVTSATAKQAIDVFVNGTRVTVLKNATAGVVPQDIPVPSFALVNNSTTANTMVCDYFWTCLDRDPQPYSTTTTATRY